MENKVYVVFEECQEDRWIVGVFFDEQEAEDCAKKVKNEGRYGSSVEGWKAQ